MSDPTTNAPDAELDEDARIIAWERSVSQSQTCSLATQESAMAGFTHRARTRWPALVARERERIEEVRRLRAELDERTAEIADWRRAESDARACAQAASQCAWERTAERDAARAKVMQLTAELALSRREVGVAYLAIRDAGFTKVDISEGIASAVRRALSALAHDRDEARAEVERLRTAPVRITTRIRPEFHVEVPPDELEASPVPAPDDPEPSLPACKCGVFNCPGHPIPPDDREPEGGAR